MTTFTKEYATGIYKVNPPKEYRDFLNQIITDSKRNFEHQLEAQSLLGEEYSKVREAHNVDCAVCLMTTEEDDSVYVMLFKNVKTNDKMYDVFRDEEEKNFFINV